MMATGYASGGAQVFQTRIGAGSDKNAINGNFFTRVPGLSPMYSSMRSALRRSASFSDRKAQAPDR